MIIWTVYNGIAEVKGPLLQLKWLLTDRKYVLVYASLSLNIIRNFSGRKEQLNDQLSSIADL